MSVESQIAKLESLLSRIRRNADKPREPQGAVGAAEGHAPVVADELPVTLAENEPPPPPVEALSSADLTEVAGVGGGAAPAELEELDMMDEEIVELGAAAPIEDLDADLAEPVPESAPRPALAAEPTLEELEVEPPVKTPPPESGRQVVSPVVSPPVAAGAAAPIAEEAEISLPEAEEADIGGDDVDALLEADLTGGPISRASAGVPTMEQLGETVELEGADAPAALLELEQPAPVRPRGTAEADALEAPLPGKEFAGGYDAALAPPEEARADLQKHRREQEAREAALSAQAPAVTFSAPPSGPISVPVATVPVVSRPVVVERPEGGLAAHVAEMIPVKLPRTPETFLELLDQSLAL